MNNDEKDSTKAEGGASAQEQFVFEGPSATNKTTREKLRILRDSFHDYLARKENCREFIAKGDIVLLWIAHRHGWCKLCWADFSELCRGEFIVFCSYFALRYPKAFWRWEVPTESSEFCLVVHNSELTDESLEGEFWPKLFQVCVDPRACEFNWPRFGLKRIGVPRDAWIVTASQKMREAHPDWKYQGLV